ncbi:MAG: ribonuclease HII [Sphingobacteriia bacterium]|nr:ribonuclease HII [Sphingobacteriia bacterium]
MFSVLEEKYNYSVIGIDEAGRGPWAGPVVACALLYSDKIPENVNDSKQLSEVAREKLYPLLLQNCAYGIGEASVDEIDELNILNATKLAMVRAYENLGKTANIILVDGNMVPKFPNNALSEFVIQGDSKVKAIAAASIIAKVYRDRLMYKLHNDFPEYNWASNKGYGTKAQIEAIEKYGITIHHRKSFKPIKEAILKLENA